MPKPMKRLGRVKHPKLGKCVKVALYAVDPNSPLGEYRYLETVALFPVKQPFKDWLGYDPDTLERVLWVSKSASDHDELRKYGQFRQGEHSNVVAHGERDDG